MKQNNCISFHIYLPFFLSYVWSSDHKYMVWNCMHMHMHTSVEIITIKKKQIKIQCSISVFLYHFQLHLIKLNHMHGISNTFFAYFSNYSFRNWKLVSIVWWYFSIENVENRAKMVSVYWWAVNVFLNGKFDTFVGTLKNFINSRVK